MNPHVRRGSVFGLFLCLILATGLIFALTTALSARPTAGAAPASDGGASPQPTWPQSVPSSEGESLALPVATPAAALHLPDQPDTRRSASMAVPSPVGGAPQRRVAPTTSALAGTYSIAAESPGIGARYNMNGENDVFGGPAIPGNTIFVTATHPSAGVIATGTTTAGSCE